MKLEEKEKILAVAPVNDGDNLGIISKQGRGLLFKSDDVRAMGKTAGGVKAIDLEDGDEVANMLVHKDEPFILIHSDKNGKLLNLEDLRIRKRARKGQVIMTGNETLEGGISIVEGSIRIRFDNGELVTLHSNNVRLDEPETPLHKMVDKHIDMIYRPWEEKDENLRYKEEKKKAEQKSDSNKLGLFADADTTDENIENKEEKESEDK